MKLTLTIEAESLQEMTQDLLAQLTGLSKASAVDGQHEATEMKRLATKIVAVRKKRKKWDDGEVKFLLTYYRQKKVAWIAAALGRPINSIYQELNKQYKLNPDMPKIRNVSKKAAVFINSPRFVKKV